MQKFKASIVALFCFNSSLASAQNAAPQGIQPTDLCYELTPDCICLTGTAVDDINKALVDGEVCDERVKILTAAADSFVPPPELHWWQGPEVIVSGVVVSFALGGLVGLLFATK